MTDSMFKLEMSGDVLDRFLGNTNLTQFIKENIMTTFNEALAAHTDAVNNQLQQQAGSIAEILELVQIVAHTDAEKEELAAKVAELEAQNTEAIDRLTALTEALQADDEPVTPDVTTEAVEPVEETEDPVTPDVTTESAPEVDVELPEPTEPAPTPIVAYDDSGLESPLPPVEIVEPSRPTPPSGVPADDATPIYGAGSGSAFDPMP